MTLSQLVVRSMKKNVKHYYLYFFALIFSVTLCVSFITLQNNSMVLKTVDESGTATAGFEAATYILYFIVTFFVLYANHLFMKRRSKEIGLYQLVGMTKGLIVRLIALENTILFVMAVGIGMVIGYLSSRFFAMVLMFLLEKEVVVDLSFSVAALRESCIIFSVLLVVIFIQMTWMIRRVTLLSLFTASKQADERVKRVSVFHMLVGALGIVLIIYGYFESTRLFDVEVKSNLMNNLFINMIIILASTVGGTYLLFRYSVALLMNVVRVRKKGHLGITDVLAVTPIMHRMKGNAKSLTLITVLTGLAIGISSLAYIAYYSSGTNARQTSPYDYILLNNHGTVFMEQLEEVGIEFEKDTYHVNEVSMDLKELVSKELIDSPLLNNITTTAVISISDYQQLGPSIDLDEGEAFFTSYRKLLSEVLPLQKEKEILIQAGDKEIPVYITDIRDEFILSEAVSNGGPILVVSDKMFEVIDKEHNEEVIWTSQIGVNLLHKEDLAQAENIYASLTEERTIVVNNQDNPLGTSYIPESYEKERGLNLSFVGITVFISAFLGFAFLLTTGSILYFKQIAEAEEEKESYTILRKIGFSTSDIMRGIYRKQLFNFGVPLLIGLLHSYFAVKSGWWLFGTELVTPLIITMTLYAIMYVIFALLAVGYYRKVVYESL